MISCSAALLTATCDLCSFGHVFIFSSFASPGRLARMCLFGQTWAEVRELKLSEKVAGSCGGASASASPQPLHCSVRAPLHLGGSRELQRLTWK